MAYRKPAKLVRATCAEEVSGCLGEASDFADSGGHVTGFLSYEAASGLDPVHRTKRSNWPVLAWFALYDTPPTLHRELLPCYEDEPLREVRPEIDYEAYRDRFDAVKCALAAGVSYQVNLTFRMRLQTSQTAGRFFTKRCGVDPPKYAAFLCGGDWSIASFSPELLFERNDDTIMSRPMKGTALVPGQRELIHVEAARLAADTKSRAENVMIVDMVRNDLGSICETGSISVQDLLRVERHRELLQMTSSVRGRSSARTSDLIRHLFPAASVTGAPKASTMQLIRDLEVSPRHVYCGAIGTMSQQRQRFSVGIRTALLHRDGSGEFGVGSGIVWDSDPQAEYAECLAKCERLIKPATQWCLREAMSASDLRDPGRHLDRLKRSGEQFGIELNEQRLRADLQALEPNGRPKVGIGVRLNGEHDVQAGFSETRTPELRAELAKEPVHSSDPNLRIKSTSRAVFSDRLNECPEADDVLLYNEREELTEFTRGNVVLRIDGQLWTPHPSSGCLGGVGIGRMLEEGSVHYRALTLADLAIATEVLFVNSVVGLVRVRGINLV